MGKLKSFILSLCIPTFLLLSGCGVSSSSNQSSSSSSLPGRAVLGPLADALVRIYEVGDNGTLLLKWEERTTSGKELQDIGLFNSHSGELNPNKFYLYEVTGGCDWDVNDDGSKDDSCTENKGKVRLLIKGEDVKNLGANELRVTLLSEFIYEQLAYELDNSSRLEKGIDYLSGILVTKDINGDGEVDTRDVAAFHPVENRDALPFSFKEKMTSLSRDLLNGTEVVFSYTKTSSRMNINFKITNATADKVVGFYSPNISKVFLLFVSSDSFIKVLDISDPFNIHEVGNVTSLGYVFPDFSHALSPDGKKFALFNNGKLYIVNENGEFYNPYNSTRPVEDFVFSLDNDNIIYMDNGTSVIQVDLESGASKELYNYSETVTWGHKLFIDSNRLFLLMPDEGEGLVINLSDSSVKNFDFNATGNPKVLIFNGKLFVYDSNSGNLKIYDVRNISDDLRKIKELQLEDDLGDFAVTPKGSRIVIYGTSKAVVIDAVNLEELGVLDANFFRGEVIPINESEALVIAKKKTGYDLYLFDLNSSVHEKVTKELKIPHDADFPISTGSNLWLYSEDEGSLYYLNFKHYPEIKVKTFGILDSSKDICAIFPLGKTKIGLLEDQDENVFNLHTFSYFSFDGGWNQIIESGVIFKLHEDDRLEHVAWSSDFSKFVGLLYYDYEVDADTKMGYSLVEIDPYNGTLNELIDITDWYGHSGFLVMDEGYRWKTSTLDTGVVFVQDGNLKIYNPDANATEDYSLNGTVVAVLSGDEGDKLAAVVSKDEDQKVYQVYLYALKGDSHTELVASGVGCPFNEEYEYEDDDESSLPVMAFSKDGKFAAMVCRDFDYIKVMKLFGNKYENFIILPYYSTYVGFTDDNRFLILRNEDLTDENKDILKIVPLNID